MKKRIFIKLIVVFLVMIFIAFNNNIVSAADGISEQGKSWLDTGAKHQPSREVGDNVFSFLDRLLNISDNDDTQGFGQIVGLLMGIGVFVLTIVGIILGIRLMFASSEQKAKSKEALIIYLVGAFIILGALGIWKLLIEILDADYLY